MKRRERGLAAVTAILIVAIAASAAAMMLSRQSVMLDQTLMVTSRAQADLYAQAGIDWARGVLTEDAAHSKDFDGLDEGWAKPIAGVPVERAVVAGALVDEHGKFNLNNLVNGNTRSEPDLRIFRGLLGELGLAPDLAEAVLDWIDRDHDLSGNGGAEDSYYLGLARPYRAANAPIVQVEELYRVRGFDARAVALVKPHVTALPARSAINVNTASEPVLAALLGAAARDKAPLLLAQQRKGAFRQKTEFSARLAELGVAAPPVDTYDVKGGHFLARVQVAQDEVQLATEALLRRNENGTTAMVWRRSRY